VHALRRAAPERAQLPAELLPGGAVQEEVDGVVDVHEKLADGADEDQLGGERQVGHEAVGQRRRPAGRGDERRVHGERGEQERERDGQQHDAEPPALGRPRRRRVAARRRAAVTGPQRQARRRRRSLVTQLAAVAPR